MMATRNPKVVPKRKPSKPQARESTLSKDQGWTDTDDTEGTKESGESSDQTKDVTNIGQAMKGSLISVKEADESNREETGDEANQSETNGVSHDNPQTTDTEVQQTTDTEGVNGTETDSLGSMESGTRRRFKRNTVVPTDAEDSGRQTDPEVESRKDAWSVAETDADVESNAASSRPSSAHHRARQRPATAVAQQVTPAASIPRPMTAPAVDYRSQVRPGTTGASRPKSSGSRPRSRGDEERLSRPTSSAESPPLAITNGEVVPWEEPSPDSSMGMQDRESSSSRSSGLLAPPQLQGEQNAYIPYIYAKDCIQKVMDDMKKMKSNHVKVIDRIQDQYKSVEDDIQAKFNTFVLNLRNEYSNKVTTFRQVITIHREDSLRTNTHWEDTVKSLQAKNQTLLNEKRQLLIKNREEFTQLENEKVTAVKDLTRMLDERHAKYTLLLTDFKNEQGRVRELEEKLKSLEEQGLKQQEESESQSKSHQDEITALKEKHQGEVTELKQQLELVQKEKQEKQEEHEKVLKEREEEETKKINELTEKHASEKGAFKAELQKLQEEIEALKASGVAAVATTTTVVTTTAVKSESTEPQTTEVLKEETQAEVKEEDKVTDQAAPVSAAAAAAATTTTVTVLDNAEKERLTQEIAKLQEELEKNKTEVTKYKEELEEGKERIVSLEEEVSHLGKEKTRFEKQATDNKKELRETRQQCTALREQLQGLLVVTASAGQVDDNETEEKLKAAEAEKQALVDEQNKMKEEFEKWKEQYRQEHEGEEPSEDDRTEEVQAMMEKLKQEEEKLKKAENTIAVMTMLKEGTVPETVATAGVADSSSKVEELEDKVSQLEAARDELEVSVEKLTKEKEALEEKVSEQEQNNNELTEKNAELTEKVAELEKEVEELRNELDEIGDGVPVATSFSSDGVDVERMSSKLTELEEELAKANNDLEQEKATTLAQIEEIEALKKELANLRQGSSGEVDELKAQLASTKEVLEADIKNKEEALTEAKKRIEELEKKLLENVPIDTAKEIGAYQEKMAALEKEKEKVVKESLTVKASVSTLTAKVETLTKNIEQQKQTEKELQDANAKMRAERVKELKDTKDKAEAKSKKQIEENNKKIQALQKRIKELEAGGVKPQDSKIDSGLGAKRKDSRAAADLEKANKEKEKLQGQVEALKKAAQEDHAKIKQLEKDLKEAQTKAKPAGPSAEERAAAKKQDKQMKDLTKNLEMEKKKFEKIKETLTKTEEELKGLKKEHDALLADSKKDKDTLSKLEVAAQEGLAAQEKVDELSKEVKSLREENKTLSDNYNSERILRKKYYNMVEDMKGKIRVYCRARPLSKSEKERGNYSVIKSPDEYTLIVETSRGPKDFQYDQVFTPEHGQEKVFEDTNNLIQSAVDGYNVCIFAYGQTGSGKTYTMIGDKELKSPGIAPRAMEAIFNLMNEQKSKFSFKVHCYMLELYNDRLIDLLAPHGKEPAKLDIKKDKKGLVFVQGSILMEAATKEELWNIFEKGSENRHVASTKMNAESSRSHLILGIIIESTNLTSGAVVKGKISLVDLAGSERANKTGATAEQLKEAQSINKSLSALGDVISALSSEQQFIPYRNNKLTMLMQDSLGGNAKTLMFVNISPADYNTDETVTSLTYASRVKLITNDAQKNSENKEIARLKGIIAKLKKGEAVDDAEVDESTQG
ncbi:hypothetical protein ABFA07_002571 [Porites harrisoni]